MDLPELPKPDHWIEDEARRHGAHICYFNEQNVSKYGREGVWIMGYSHDQMHAYARAALSSALPQPDSGHQAEQPVSSPEAAAVAAWQPIETAPRDGREVVLAVAYRAGIRHGVLVGHHMGGGHCIEDHPAIDAGWYFWNGSMFDKASKPTHWMPLPHHPQWEPGGWQARKQETKTLRTDEQKSEAERSADTPAPEPSGTFACPICGHDKPHPHNEETIAAYRDDQIRDDGWISCRNPAKKGWYLCRDVSVPFPPKEWNDPRRSQLNWFLWVREGASRGEKVPEVLYFDNFRWTLRNLLGTPTGGDAEARYEVSALPRYWREVPPISVGGSAS